MTIQTFGVIGAGQMGGGIAHVAALSGYDVILQDVSEAQLQKGLAVIEKNLGRQVKKERITESVAKETLARIQTHTDVSAFESADLVVEAATENVDLKFRIFEALSKATREEAILASNTSSISITAIAARTQRPDRVIGMHFMNPVPIMKLVEIIRGLATSDETYATVNAAAEHMGKTTVLGRDMPGFIVNRVLMPYINEAVYALYEGIANEADIDTAMKLGTNVPMGPLTLADFIGLDTCLAIMHVLHDGMGGDSKYRPCPLLTKYVEAGWLGRKNGSRIFDYREKKMSQEAVVLWERVGAVDVCVINRPKALNALNGAVIEALHEGLLARLGDEALRAIVLRGGGEKAFVAGADIAQMQSLTAVEAEAFAAKGQALGQLMQEFPCQLSPRYTGLPWVGAVSWRWRAISYLQGLRRCLASPRLNSV